MTDSRTTIDADTHIRLLTYDLARRDLEHAVAVLTWFRNAHEVDLEGMEEDNTDPVLFAVATALDAAFDDLDSAMRTLESPHDFLDDDETET